MAIKKFVVGKWYKWTGRPTEYLGAREPEMLCDGKPRKCLSTNNGYIKFSGIPGSWHYNGFEEYFTICREPSKKKARKP